jgi:adenylate cyclase
MKAYTRRRLQASVKLGVASIPAWMALTLMQGRAINAGTFILSFGIGFAVGTAELFFLRSWLRQLPFLSHLAVKSLAITAVIYVAAALLNILDVIIDGMTWQAYADTITSAEWASGLVEAFGMIAFLLFFVHLDRLLGPGVLLGYVTGRYHHPHRESRIFMFLDLKGSTSLADVMDPDRYFAFLHQYFTEMSDPILETSAEIYQYVGDEIVLSWKMKSGLEEAGCIRVFFLIEDQIHAHRERFRTEYGVVPTFKAGVHAGDVITAQIGELKSEIVHNGDVLNTTARIQGLCNELGHKLLVSAELMDELELGPEYVVEELGPVELRGKGEAAKLYAVSRANGNRDVRSESS